MRGSSVLSAALRSGTSDEISLPMSSVIPDFLTNPLVGSTRSKSKHHRLCVCVCVFAEELLLFDVKTLTFDLQAAASWCLTVVYSSDDFFTYDFSVTDTNAACGPVDQGSGVGAEV